MIDDRDNDYDGLKDEDARNARGHDEDDDALLTNPMADDPAALVKKMFWADVAGSDANKCPDITAGTMPAPPYQRRNCVGALEHRIHLAKTYGAAGEDTLAAFY